MHTVWCIVTVFFIYIIICANACPTSLSIWPTGKTSYEATIRVSWDRQCDPNPNRIELYDRDPTMFDLIPQNVIEIGNDSSSSVQVVVDRRIGKISLPGGWNRDTQSALNASKPKSYPRGRCLDLYVASYRDEQLLSVNCLKVQPNWMRLNQQLLNMQLKNVFIPGSHASGCYYNISKKRSLKIEKYFHTQNYDVWTQLVFGVRFLDLTIGYKSKYENERYNFWAINDDVFINPLHTILEDVEAFVRSSGEIVLLDFNPFKIYFADNGTTHRKVVNVLEEILGRWIFRRNKLYNDVSDVTIHEIIEADKNIILMHFLDDLNRFGIETDIFWPRWTQISTANINDTEMLDKMSLLFSGRENSSFRNSTGSIFHAVRSHNILAEIDGRVSTVRERAINVNSKLTTRLSGPWSLHVNVITADFVMSTNLIELAILTNRYKAFQETNKYIKFNLD